jgi:hypothetical protein
MGGHVTHVTADRIGGRPVGRPLRDVADIASDYSPGVLAVAFLTCSRT